MNNPNETIMPDPINFVPKPKPPEPEKPIVKPEPPTQPPSNEELFCCSDEKESYNKKRKQRGLVLAIIYSILGFALLVLYLVFINIIPTSDSGDPTGTPSGFLSIILLASIGPAFGILLRTNQYKLFCYLTLAAGTIYTIIVQIYDVYDNSGAFFLSLLLPFTPIFFFSIRYSILQTVNLKTLLLTGSLALAFTLIVFLPMSIAQTQKNESEEKRQNAYMLLPAISHALCNKNECFQWNSYLFYFSDDIKAIVDEIDFESLPEVSNPNCPFQDTYVQFPYKRLYDPFSEYGDYYHICELELPSNFKDLLVRLNIAK
jgi:hypothetical protein